MSSNSPRLFDRIGQHALFTPGLVGPPGQAQDCLWFVYQDDRLIVAEMDADDACCGQKHAPLPIVEGATGPALPLLRRQYLGCWDKGEHALHCYAGELASGAALPAGFASVDLHSLFGVWDDRWVSLAGRAKQVSQWERDHQYCSRCGTRTEGATGERALRCPQCGLTSYPRISPAIIIAVTRKVNEGEEILLARNHRFPAGRYSVIAGFVEAGETLEECAQREVMEEVGVQITNIRYFGSQPWPFPHSLMIGFLAEYAGGEINLEESEIAEAGWFGPTTMPQLPPKISIARRLIEHYLSNAGNETVI